MKNETALISLQDFSVSFIVEKKELPAASSVNLNINRGEILGLVGESGCGKSVMSQSLLRLYEDNYRVKYNGKVLWGTQDILQLTSKELQKIRGDRISVIFQNPMSSLSPVHTIGEQLCDVMSAHIKGNRKSIRSSAVRLLSDTGIPEPDSCMSRYPFELSGGMLQRVVIAMALACEPALLIADEPTTALDPTIRKGILYLIEEQKNRLGMSVLFISHNLSEIAEICDRVCVMYAGNIVETASVYDLFSSPLHPYTRGLLKSLLNPEQKRKEKLPVLSGAVPDLSTLPSGCKFHPRCPYSAALCEQTAPIEREVSPNHTVCCHNV